MTNKQTAVGWLINELTNKQNGNGSNNSIDEIYNQAIQKEREQIEEAYIDGMEFIPVDPDKYKSDAEQYYTQTYGECTHKS